MISYENGSEEQKHYDNEYPDKSHHIYNKLCPVTHIPAVQLKETSEQKQYDSFYANIFKLLFAMRFRSQLTNAIVFSSKCHVP